MRHDTKNYFIQQKISEITRRKSDNLLQLQKKNFKY